MGKKIFLKAVLFLSVAALCIFQFYWLVNYYNQAYENLQRDIINAIALAEIQVMTGENMTNFDPFSGGFMNEVFEIEILEDSNSLEVPIEIEHFREHSLPIHKISFNDERYLKLDSLTFLNLKKAGLSNDQVRIKRHFRDSLSFSETEFDKAKIQGKDLFGNTYTVELKDESLFLFKKNWLFFSSICLILFLMGVSGFLLYKDYIDEKKLAALKNDFIANISHEFRTPITSMGILLEALQEHKNLTEKTINEYVELSVDENTRLGNLVESILKSVVQTKTNGFLKTELFNVNNAIKQAIDSVSVQLIANDVEINFTPFTKKAVVSGDLSHFINGLRNIILNAIKYCEARPVIVIFTRKNNNNIVIEIEDNGIGIPKSHRKGIFKKFYRIPKGNRHDIKGLGLGLFYTNSVITAMSGKITVDKAVKKGSVFTITLPLNENQDSFS